MEYEKLAVIGARVEAARKRQPKRFAHTDGVTCPADIRDHCELEAAGQSLIKAAMRQPDLSVCTRSST